MRRKRGGGGAGVQGDTLPYSIEIEIEIDPPLQHNPFNPIVPNWLKVAFQLDTMEYLCHTKVQVPLTPQCRMALCPSWW